MPEILKSKLRAELERLSEQIRTNRIVSTPFISRQQVEDLTADQIIKILPAIEFQRKLFADARSESDPNEQNKRMFRSALERLKLKTVDSIEDRFEGGDIIEIYDHQTIQRFHNLEFHRVCSYSLLELYTMSFAELYSRSTKIIDLMMAKTIDVFYHGDRTIRFDIPYHHIREVRSTSKMSFGVQFKWLSPLKDESGETVACVCTNRSTPRNLTILN